MATIELDGLSLDELKKLQRDVNKAVDGFQERRRREALAEVESKAREMGFSLAELSRGVSKTTKQAPAPKYRNPENASQTWTGRGRQPDWIKDALAAGKAKDDFLI